MSARLTVVQLLPQLEVGGVERGTVQIAQALQRAGHRAIVVSAPGRMVAELSACGAEHIPLGIGDKRLSSLGHVRNLGKVFRRYDIDIVHARSRLPAWLGKFALRPLRRNGRPAWVTTVHGPYTVNPYSRIMLSGDRVIAISEFIRDYILQSYRGVDPACIEVIPRGVDRSIFSYGYAPPADWRAQWDAQHARIAGAALLTLPARLTRWKGQLDFIELIAELRRRGCHVHGLVAGEAHRRKQAFALELRERVIRLRLDGAISFLGRRDDLRDILAISDVAFSLTSEPEAFGRTTVEALSLGTPVIGYDHGGTGEILRSVFPAGLVPRGDVKAAADRVEAFLSAPPRVPPEHPYTVERMQQATLALYERLVAVNIGAAQPSR